MGHHAADTFPLLDFITECAVVEDATGGAIDTLEDPAVLDSNRAGRGG